MLGSGGERRRIPYPPHSKEKNISIVQCSFDEEHCIGNSNTSCDVAVDRLAQQLARRGRWGPQSTPGSPMPVVVAAPPSPARDTPAGDPLASDLSSADR
eukprot:scaffold130256_cov69-Phaeocystis_antarctica.AAC.1